MDGQQVQLMLSKAATVAQWLGSAGLALAFFYLSRLYDRPEARRWSWAWMARAVSLTAVWGYYFVGGRVWMSLYVAAAWSYLGLLYGGLRCFRRQRVCRPSLWMVGGVIPVALALPWLPALPTLNELFPVHSVFAAVGYGAVWVESVRVPSERRTPGLRLLTIALSLAAVTFACYPLLFRWFPASAPERPDWVSYTPLWDLLLDILIAFGALFVVAEESRVELNAARERMERLARTDPLTEALSRHALYSGLVDGSHLTGGCVVMADIDGLKALNDAHGHRAGDAAIRAAASALRGALRTDDLLFRWGGDEFLAVIPQLAAAAMRERLARLDAAPAEIAVDGRTVGPLRLTWGAADFGPEQPLEKAIEAADAEMYGKRRAPRGR